MRNRESQPQTCPQRKFIGERVLWQDNLALRDGDEFHKTTYDDVRSDWPEMDLYPYLRESKTPEMNHSSNHHSRCCAPQAARPPSDRLRVGSCPRPIDLSNWNRRGPSSARTRSRTVAKTRHRWPHQLCYLPCLRCGQPDTLRRRLGQGRACLDS